MARHQPHLLVPLPTGDDPVPVDQETRHHLEKALRFDTGLVTYTDGEGLVGEGVYEHGMVIRGDETLVPRPDLITVAVAPPHSNSRVRFVVEKLAELGVSQLVWLQAKHGQGRPPRSDKSRAWVRSALEQSRGAWLMEVHGLVPVPGLGEFGTPIFADPSGATVDELPAIDKPVLCIGPEGGFGRDEVPETAARLRLGATILRVETAAIAGAVLLRGSEMGPPPWHSTGKT
ncbi:MAG: RsmE family RNA methyltransferase [Acidimicrobiia bacterium]|nr:RsmE family RNA methyltransferase [Acidimicrobiia bacterium]